MTFKIFLESNDACGPAIEWLETSGLFDNPQAAWDTCVRGDWMMWWLQEEGSTDIRTITAIKAEQVEQVRHLLADPRSIAALDATHAFGRGEISEKELKAAAAHTFLAYANAADYAAIAIANSITNAIKASAASACAAAPYAASLSKSADIVRQFVPKMPLNFI